MPDQKRLAKIHIAKKDLNLGDENYRDILSGFGVESAKDLSDQKADAMLLIFKKLGWKPKRSSSSSSSLSKKGFQIKLPENRSEDFATQPQINMLVGMWVEKSREKTEESFRKFVSNIAKVDRPEWLLRADVQKVRIAIKNLKQAEANG